MNIRRILRRRENICPLGSSLHASRKLIAEKEIHPLQTSFENFTTTLYGTRYFLLHREKRWTTVQR